MAFNGLLGMGGFGGTFGGPKTGALSGPLAQLFNPTSMRNSQIKKGLLSAGMAMMNPDPYAPPAGIGGIIGRAAAGGLQGADQAKQEFMQDGFMGMQLQEMQREQDERAAQDKAVEELIPKLPPDMQSFARAYRPQFMEAYMKAKMGGGGEAFTLSPGQTRFDASGKPIVSGGPDQPKYQEVTLEDGVYAVDFATGQKHKIGERPNRNEGEGRDFTQEYKIREEYLKQAKPFADLRVNYQRIQAAANDNTGASDIAMVYSYMKMLDPTSVVREGEFATAQNAGGVDSQLIAMYNKLLSGERLAPQVRSEFMQQAGRQFEQQKASYGETRKMYQGLAAQYGLDPERVAPDITYGVEIGQPNQSGLNPDALRQKYNLRPSR